jgi:hypothetical protein
LFTLVWVLISHPLAALLSQFAKPGLQEPTPQTPAAQVAVALLADPHALPHAPQLATSVAVLIHDAPHRVVPAGHTLPQTPLEQTAPAGQAFPQAPQFCESLCRLTSVVVPVGVVAPLTTVSPESVCV